MNRVARRHFIHCTIRPYTGRFRLFAMSFRLLNFERERDRHNMVRMRHFRFLLPAFLLAVLASCQENRTPAASEPNAAPVLPETERLRCNAVYHWKTTFSLDSAELSFLEKNDVRRMYVRLFDVDLNTSPMDSYANPVPVGTTLFREREPQGVEVVPCVFITTKVLKFLSGPSLSHDEPSGLASRIYKRVKNMMDYNGLGPLTEIQLDCDWTESTRDIFYGLCKKVTALAHADSVETSATIRLHQLSSTPPPVDRGVLMVYNTGALRSSGTRNSILDYNDVKAYLGGKTIHYGIPLDFAFPTYGWGVLFRKGTFMCILHETDFGDANHYSANSDGTFTVRRDHVLEGHYLYEGDIIRLEYPDAEVVNKAADLTASSVLDSLHSVILYHLDSNNLAKYTDDDIAQIYSH